jgi:hypothetical protein
LTLGTGSHCVDDRCLAFVAGRSQSDGLERCCWSREGFRSRKLDDVGN